MVITRLAVTDFRNLENGELFPCEGVNVIYGGNAQGKTNLLEAVWLFTGGHSFRGAKDSELPRMVRQGEPARGKLAGGAFAERGAAGEGPALRNLPSAGLALDFFSEGRPQKAVLQIENGRRSSVINGVKKKTGSALIGKVRAVIFSPEHLLLVKEGPNRRRSFLDGALCQLRPGFAGALGVYNRALAQRNALLKDLIRFPELRDTLEVWDARLAKLGAQVLLDRRSYVDKLAPKVQDIYNGISRGKEEIRISYSTSLKLSDRDFFSPDLQAPQIEEAFLQDLRRTVQSDIRTGFTSVGPHRDDMEITLNGLSARAYGSQGQQRSCVLALKLAEAEALAEVSGETPIVLLDDVMSELDRDRQDYLLNHLHGRQVFITCCSPETVSLQETGKRFRVEAGHVEPEDVNAS